MVSKLRYKIAKFFGKSASHVVSLGGGMGKSFAGWLFLKIGSYEALEKLSKEPSLGSILITGTNGKTTTTNMIIRLCEEDLKINYNYESNTINAIATGLLKGPCELGIFEYGIRDLEHGIPDTIQRLVNPIGVIYTTISREHTQVLGVKNPFKNYIQAKSLLSANIKNGTLIVNCDDPITTYLGMKKEDELPVNYYGLGIDDFDDFYPWNPVECPACNQTDLKYSKRIMNHRGLYECECGFKRPEPNVKLTNIRLSPERWYITIEGDLFNYTTKKQIQFKVNTDVPPFGVHNLYNVLCSTTAYASFTPKIDNIENTVEKVFKEMTMGILPPGRFELVKVNDKIVGLGQGDNGDAVKANVSLISPYIDKNPCEFIYTTPDINEEEIFEDHLESIRLLNPEHLIVIPGRESIEVAKDYYNQLKDEFDCDFYPLSYEKMDERINKICDLVYESKYKYILITGCGEEQIMWENIKQDIKKH